MVTDKVTIEMLEQFAVGDTMSYTLPNWDKARDEEQGKDLRMAVQGPHQPCD